MRRLNYAKPHWVLWILIGLSLLWLILANRCGVGYTNDSYDYLAAAESLKQQGIMLTSKGEVYTDWPPLFSLTLYLFSLDSPFKIALLNLLSFTLSAVILMQLLGEYYHCWSFRVAAFLPILLGLPWQLVHQFAWSEAGFILLHTAHLLAFYHYINSRKSVHLNLMILLIMMLCLQRHVAVFYLASTSLALLFLPNSPLNSNIKRTLFYTIFGSSLWVMWVIYAIYHRGWLFNPVMEGVFSAFGHNIYLYMDSLSLWFLPSILPFYLRMLLILVVLLGAMWLSLRHGDFFTSYLLGSSLLYLALMINMEASNFWEVERFVVLTYAPLVLCFGKLLEVLYLSSWLSTTQRKVLIFCLIISLIYPLTRGIKHGYFRQNINCNTNTDYSLTSPKYKH